MPLLNTFGQKFYENGFRLTKGHVDQKTIPLWASVGAQGTISRSLGSSVPVNWALTEIASYGYVDKAQLLYHFEYQPTEKQTNIYVLHPFSKNLTAQVGEVGLLAQYDPRLDVFQSRSTSTYRQGGAGPLSATESSGPSLHGSNAYGVRMNYSRLTGNSAMPYLRRVEGRRNRAIFRRSPMRNAT